MPRVSEPFEGNNVARAVHEKMKFEAIKAEFAEVCVSLDNRALFILFSSSELLWASFEFFLMLLLLSLCLEQSCRILWDRKDLNSILPVRTIINKELSRR